MLIYVASPLRGDIKKNREQALLYCRYVFEQGHYPIAPHLQLAWLDDNVESERTAGMKAGIEVLKRCDELWVFGERISEGMKAEIEKAKELDIPVRKVMY